MYKVLVVDDNLIIRKSIIARINWNSMDFEIIGEASNGEEAYDLIYELRPDIVICDIKMPKLDGLTLIEKTKDKFSNIKFIIISGYDDFKYTKKAIIFNVVNYILKPINTDELITALVTAKEDIIKFKNHQEQNKIIQTTHDFNTFCDHNTQILSYLNNTIPQDNIIHFLNKLYINISDSKLVMVAVNTVSNATNLNLIYNLYEHLNNHNDSDIYAFKLTENIFIIILNPLYIPKIILQTKIILNKNGFSNIYFGCSSIVTPCEKFGTCFRECVDALYYRFLISPPITGIYCYKKIDSINVSLDDLDSYKISLNLGAKKQALETINKIFSHLTNREVNSSILKFIVGAIINTINNVLLNNNLDKTILQENSFYSYFLMKFNTLAEILHYFINITEDICTNINSNITEDKYKEIISYIKRNYNKPITVQSISEKFHMNTNYIGQLIKKQTGHTFNQYINTLRIDYAKEILSKQSEIRLSELAHSIGYADYQYFSRVFRKLTKYSPTEYINKNIPNS